MGKIFAVIVLGLVAWFYLGVYGAAVVLLGPSCLGWALDAEARAKVSARKHAQLIVETTKIMQLNKELEKANVEASQLVALTNAEIGALREMLEIYKAEIVELQNVLARRHARQARPEDGVLVPIVETPAVLLRKAYRPVIPPLTTLFWRRDDKPEG